MHASLSLLLGSALSALAMPASSRSPAPRATVCNGHAELCARKYSNVTFVGAHDSAFVGVLPTDNQFESVAEQLAQGVRFLQSQSHDDDGTIELCHTTCLEKDAGSLAEYLVPIKAFLDANTNEVVTLLITNGDGIAVADYGAVFAAVGLDAYAYAPSTTSTDSTLALADWPTLGALIDAGTRLVVFMDYHADTTVVPYILDEFAYIYETPYDTTDAAFPECTVDRPTDGDASRLMGLVNHYLDLELDLFGNKILVPDTVQAATTNAAASIVAQAAVCVQAHARPPSFVLLDWISIGDAMAAQDALNGF